MNDKQTKLELLQSFYSPNVNKEMLFKICFIKDDEEIISWLTHRQQVNYAYKCASSVTEYIEDKETKNKIIKCLNLIEQWLDNPDNVTNEQLNAAANIVWDAAYVAHAAANIADAAAYASYAVADAAHAAADVIRAANAVHAAAWAAAYATHATHAAWAAVYIADFDVVPDKQEQQQINLGFLIETALENE